MTKILRQISPEIFDQVYSLANKQNTWSWQQIFFGASAAWLPRRRPAAGSLPPWMGEKVLAWPRAPPQPQCPSAGGYCNSSLLPAFWVKPAHPFVLCCVAGSWPACWHFDKQEIHSWIGKKISFMQEWMTCFFSVQALQCVLGF